MWKQWAQKALGRIVIGNGQVEEEIVLFLSPTALVLVSGSVVFLEGALIFN